GPLLTYTPTATLTRTDSLTYAVSDGTETAMARISFEPNPARLHVTPGAALFAAAGEARTFAVRAFDGSGREFPVDDLGLVWSVDDPTALDIALESTSAQTATVTAATDLGSLLIVVRSRARPEIEPAIVPVMVARLAGGVTVIPDARISYPEPNPLPNQPPHLAPVGANGLPLIGSFTLDELILGHEIVTDTATQNPQFRYPVVLRGAAPAIGAVVLVGESRPVMGRVVRVTEREGFALVQLEQTLPTAIFSMADLSLNTTDVISSGLITADELLAPADPGADMPGQARARQGAMPPPPPGPTLSNCSIASGVQGLDIKLSDTALDLQPTLDFDYRIEEEQVTYLKLTTGFNAVAEVKAALDFQFGYAVSVDCYWPAKTLKLNATAGGWLAVLNAIAGPRITLGPSIKLEAKAFGGPRLKMSTGFRASAKLEIGVVWDRGVTQQVRRFDPQLTPHYQQTNGFENEQELISGRIEVTLGFYFASKAQFLIGGSIVDLIRDHIKQYKNDLKGWQEFVVSYIERTIVRRLTITLVEARYGPEAKLEAGNLAQALADKETTGKFDIQMTFKIEPVIFTNILKALALNFPIEMSFEQNWGIYSMYERLSLASAEVRPSPKVKEGDRIAIEANVQGPGLYQGMLFYGGQKLTDLTASGNRLTGDWSVTKEVCDDSKAQANGQVDLTIVGYNKMATKTIYIVIPVVIFGTVIPIPIDLRDRLPVPNYLGTVKVNCSDLTIDTQLFPGPDATGRITACRGNGSTFTINTQSSAEDRLGKISRIELYYDNSLVHEEDGHGTSQSLAALYSITLNHPDTSLHTIRAVVYALDEQGQPTRTKESEQQFYIDWQDDCAERFTEQERREITSRCFTRIEMREREGMRRHDPVTGNTYIDWGPWGPWVPFQDLPTGLCSIRISGDPHILTPDGLEFDSFARGEFIYLRPKAGRQGVAVQARQERITGRNERFKDFPWTSWITALAIEADGTTFEFGIDHLATPLVNGERRTLAPGLHMFGEADLLVGADGHVELHYQSTNIIIAQMQDFLELRAVVAQDGSLEGMLGTPNGDDSDDFRWPDGTPARDAFDLAEGWRITEREESLFTYAAGQGPETYNHAQIGQPPSREELAPYVEQARALLQSTCQSDVLDDIALRNAALELYTGRPATEVVQSGLCWYVVQGRVTNTLVDGLAVPGAPVMVAAPELASCHTITDRNGYYRCYMPAQGAIPSLVTIQVAGRGEGRATAAFSRLPIMGGLETAEIDLQVSPTTLEMVGHVRDGSGTPLYNAELRMQGPPAAGLARAYATANGDGFYRTYMMFDDGVVGGANTYYLTFNPQWSTNPTLPGIKSTLERPIPALKERELNTISETLVLTGSLVRFSGRVAYAFNPAKTIAGALVQITPGAPVDGWPGCNVKTLRYARAVANPLEETTNGSLVGTYSCEARITGSAPFTATIKIPGSDQQRIVTVDPAGRGVGETVPVIADFEVATTVVRVHGRVQNKLGQPVAGAELLLRGVPAGRGAPPLPPFLNTAATVQSDANGHYEAFFGLWDRFTQGEVEYTLTYGMLDRAGAISFKDLQPGAVNDVAHDINVSG
ncbi:MAG TPA: hypothetical protein VD886_05980, partial [Herpetosiphonaceae bacterium]|nr:hypothetical protein [Herpetosiphonaceae bacterium]